MTPETHHPRLQSGRLMVFGFALMLIALVLCPSARSAMPPRQTTLRGCLRATGEHAFVLIAEDRLGYVLDGNRGVLSRHTDQEVEIAGITSDQPADEDPRSSLRQQLANSKKPDKRDKAAARIPGLRLIQVSSLTPVAEQCAAAVNSR